MVEVKNVLQWIRFADIDYLGSRTLFLNGQLVPAIILANTAIEKYLKALMALSNIVVPQTHDNLNLLSSLLRNGINLKLNKEYLKLLNKFYKLRYPNDLPVGYNLSVQDIKLLVEMDYSVYIIRKGFNFSRKDDKKVVTFLDSLLENNDKSLLFNNCYYGSFLRSDMFVKQSNVFEIRVLPDKSILEINYKINGSKDDGCFNSIGLKPS